MADVQPVLKRVTREEGAFRDVPVSTGRTEQGYQAKGSGGAEEGSATPSAQPGVRTGVVHSRPSLFAHRSSCQQQAHEDLLLFPTSVMKMYSSH